MTVMEMLPVDLQERIKNGDLWDYRIYGGASQLDEAPTLAITIFFGKTKAEQAVKVEFQIGQTGPAKIISRNDPTTLHFAR